MVRRARRRRFWQAYGTANPAPAEYVALWLPLTREEKAAQLEKAAREGVNVSDLVADYLRAWAQA